MRLSLCGIAQLKFLRKVVRQSHTDMTSLPMQFEKIGRGLLREAFRGEGECVFGRKKWLWLLLYYSKN